MRVNWIGIWTVYLKEMTRTSRVIGQTIISPVITTTLYFVVFGAAVGSNIDELQGVSYGAFIMPGLIMLSLTTNSLTAASSGIYFPKWTGVIYELLTAPLSYFEICLGYVLAATTRAMIVAVIIFLVSLFYVDLTVKYPLFCLLFAFPLGNGNPRVLENSINQICLLSGDYEAPILTNFSQLSNGAGGKGFAVLHIVRGHTMGFSPDKGLSTSPANCS